MAHFAPEHIISGSQASEETLAWTRANITSINEAVQSGRHSAVYYPACGLDALRVLLAYDADHLTVVDIAEEFFGETEGQVADLGVEPTVSDVNENERSITFTYDGKERQLRLVKGDARKRGIPSEPVDVLHVYLPTGADQNILAAEDTAPQSILFPKIDSRLAAGNYQQVREGGFFVFEERRLAYADTILPPALLRSAGLSEIAITKRHPHGLMTTFASSEGDIEAMDRTGYIYRKDQTVSSETIAALNQGIGVIDNYTYEMGVLGRLDAVELNPTDNPDFDINSHLAEIFADFQTGTSATVEALKAAGADEDLLATLPIEMNELVLQASDKLKENLQAFMELYSILAEESAIREISAREAMERFGIKHDSIYGTWVSEHWPFATTVIFGSDEARSTALDRIQSLLDSL